MRRVVTETGWVKKKNWMSFKSSMDHSTCCDEVWISVIMSSKRVWMSFNISIIEVAEFTFSSFGLKKKKTHSKSGVFIYTLKKTRLHLHKVNLES